MFAVVEFMGDEDETAGEVSVVPLCWLQKNDTKCYWPINTKKKSFSDFVKDGTPYKASWPCYKIFKVHRKTALYTEAEQVMEAVINTVSQSDSSSSLVSSRSLTRKVPQDKLPIPARSESSDSEIEENRKNKSRNFNTVLVQHSSNSVIDENKETEGNACSVLLNINEPNAAMNPNKSKQVLKQIHHQSVSSASSDTVSEIASLNSGYETIAENLASIKAILAQHSIILNQLQRHAQLTNSGALVPPPNLPDFPVKSYEEFEAFENLLQDRGVETYMTNRLAAVGGTGVDSLTRRILRYVLTNDVAMLYNWKGREKKCFEKTNFMKVIYASAKLNFPANERNDLIIENAVKDWLKYSKSRHSRAKK